MVLTIKSVLCVCVVVFQEDSLVITNLLWHQHERDHNYQEASILAQSRKQLRQQHHQLRKQYHQLRQQLRQQYPEAQAATPAELTAISETQQQQQQLRQQHQKN